MRGFSILLFVSISFSCVAQDISYNDEPCTKNDSIVVGVSFGFGNTNHSIAFDDGFDNDYLVVKIKKQLIYEGLITTDQSLGLAKGLQFDKDAKRLIILINDRKLKIKNKRGYRFIQIDKVDDNYKIEYRKRPVIYL